MRGLIDSAAEGHDLVGTCVDLVIDLAEQNIDDLLRECFISCDAGDVTGQMIPDIAKDRFQIGRPL